MNTRPTNILIAGLSLALLASTLSTAFSSSDGSESTTKTKQEALHRAIKGALSLNLESHLSYTSSPCVSSWTVTPNSPATFDNLGDVTPPYICTVTAMSGNIYTMSIELIKLNDKYMALPADTELLEDNS